MGILRGIHTLANQQTTHLLRKPDGGKRPPLSKHLGALITFVEDADMLVDESIRKNLLELHALEVLSGILEKACQEIRFEVNESAAESAQNQTADDYPIREIIVEILR